MSEVTDMTKEELLSSLNKHIEEVVFRYNDVWESYENLDEDYKRLQSRYNKLKEENDVLKQEELENQKAYDLGFEDGEQSMQEKANKIIEFYRDNNNDIYVLQKVFSLNTIFDDQILEDIEGAYNKIIEYEKKKEQEFHVGDEVVDRNGVKYVVRALDGGNVRLFGHSGEAFMLAYPNVSKTGKHYCLDEILKELE